MMGRILNNHPHVYTFQELHFFDELITGSDSGRQLSLDRSVRLFSLLLSVEREGYFGERRPEKYTGEASRVLHGSNRFKAPEVYGLFLSYVTRSSGKQHACDQTPQNIFYSQEILDTLDDARVIVMVRDPRDVLLSQKNKWKRKKLAGDNFPVKESIRAWFNYHPFTISRLWKAVMNEVSGLRDDTRVMKIRFEDLTSDPENTVKKVCEHLGLEFHLSMLKVPKVGSSNIRDTQSDQSIDASRSGRWKDGELNDTEIRICESVNKALMIANGYEVSEKGFNILYSLYYLITFPLKSLAAVFFNLHRLRDPSKVFKRLFR